MTGPQLIPYVRTDITASTSPSVYGTRTIRAAGCLIHSSSGTDSRSWLQGASTVAGQPVSADALIDRQGAQWLIVPPGHYAYHAGASAVYIDRWYRNSEVNQVLVGIELECLDTEPPTWPQYDSLADLILYYALHHGWRWPFFIFAHSGVALPHGRRSDPVYFDWGDLFGRLYVRGLATGLAGM